MILSLIFCIIQAGSLYAYEYNANDFATEVVSYIQGTGVGWDVVSLELYNNPLCALGGPTVETTASNGEIPGTVSVPINPVHPAWRSYEVVTIGRGGELIVKFNHPVANDAGNPYGIDFIVFGNARMHMADGASWNATSDPEIVEMTGTMFAEPGLVSVSQDGITWYVYDDVNTPRADSFAPTASYRWDDFNNVWTERLDPTRPIDPNLQPADMTEKTVAEGLAMYGDSAGGAGFDIDKLGLDWIQYVRIRNDANTPSGITTEIDAVADVSCCGDYKHPLPPGDITGDCKVNWEDAAILTERWLATQNMWDETAESADIYSDDKIDFYDLAVLGNDWLNCTWECE
jgi:hypothetical protein